MNALLPLLHYQRNLLPLTPLTQSYALSVRRLKQKGRGIEELLEIHALIYHSPIASRLTDFVLVGLNEHVQLVKVKHVMRHDRFLLLVLLPQTHELVR